MNTLLHSAILPNGSAFIAALVKRAYRMSRGRRAEITAETPPFATEPTYAPSANAEAMPRFVEDNDLMAIAKPYTDVLLRGHAHARTSVSMLDTAVRISGFEKRVRVWGPRVITLDTRGRICFSSPASFSSFPLTWDHAYGGRDAHAERELHPRKPALLIKGEPAGEPHGALSYPRNPSGRGFFIDVNCERIANTLAPNLEDPEDPVTPDRLLAADALDWIDRPASACYEPVAPLAFPRSQFFLPPERAHSARAIRETTEGVLATSDLERVFNPKMMPDPRFYNCSAAGFRRAALAGDERVSLWNLHRSAELFEFDLPAERPKILMQPPGCEARELCAVLKNVLVEPDDDRVTLTWCALMATAMPFPDEVLSQVRHAVVWERG